MVKPEQRCVSVLSVVVVWEGGGGGGIHSWGDATAKHLCWGKQSAPNYFHLFFCCKEVLLCTSATKQVA